MVLREASFQTEGEMYLFGSVLSEFFSLYSTVNSFHVLEVRGEQRGEVYRWPIKIGRQPLI
jgi:type VI secretion system protein ImpG